MLIESKAHLLDLPESCKKKTDSRISSLKVGQDVEIDNEHNQSYIYLGDGFYTTTDCIDEYMRYDTNIFHKTIKRMAKDKNATKYKCELNPEQLKEI
jgi:hypothetical protein